MKVFLSRTLCFFFTIAAISFVLTIHGNAQGKMDRIEKERMKSMLRNIKNAIKKDYYDPNYHGIDLEDRFEKAEERLKEVNTTGQSLAVIAQVLLDFNDSHLYFIPPATNLEVEYGWRASMYGDKCLVWLVKPKSDAESKGLKPGDQILDIENFRPSRSEFWKMMYYYNILSKRSALKIHVLSPGDEKPHELLIESKIDKLPKAINIALLFDLFDPSAKSDVAENYFAQIGGVAVWKMPSFAIAPSSIDILIKKIKESQSTVLDLRGNGGGYADTLERLASYMFDHDLSIAELKGRKEMDPQKSKTKGDDSYSGKLIVLIDQGSGSASEIFARLVQLEKRGLVFGDVSAGAVMQSRTLIATTGANDEITYAASITNADVIMSDGKSLERTGVTPDMLLLPSGDDILNHRDPVLAKAIQALGGTITADEAGRLFQYKWKSNDRIIIETR